MKEALLKKIENREITVGVVGLGYVGLPLAVEKAKAGFKTIGFDVQEEKVNLVNPAYETARELKSLLERDGLNNDGKQNYEGAMHEFYVSDAANKFKNFANSILPYGVDTTQLIHIEDY